jgi:hypothetical protein
MKLVYSIPNITQAMEIIHIARIAQNVYHSLPQIGQFNQSVHILGTYKGTLLVLEPIYRLRYIPILGVGFGWVIFHPSGPESRLNCLRFADLVPPNFPDLCAASSWISHANIPNN